MLPSVSHDLREQVTRALHATRRTVRGPSLSTLLSPFETDLRQFHAQAAALAEAGLSQRVALFEDEDGEATQLPVLLAPALSDLKGSYARLSFDLDQSGHELRDVDDGEAARVLIERLAEHLAVRARRLGPAGAGTIVNSRRSGDTIIYCKGYFISTATGFGTSTPTQRALPPGRYMFGLNDSGRNKFDGLIWTCPTIVRLNLP